MSAWSAAASDIYISSRFLFFLARRGHAPSFVGSLFRNRERDPEKQIVVPWVGVLVAAAFASLSFMSAENALQVTVFSLKTSFI
jgi:amino acid permease